MKADIVKGITPKTTPVTSTNVKATEGIRKISDEELGYFQVLSDDDKLKYLEDNYPTGRPIPGDLRNEAKRLGYLTSESASTMYGAIKNPTQATAAIKASNDRSVDKTEADEKIKLKKSEEELKRLSSVVSKPVSQKVIPTGGSTQSVPRQSGNLGTSISGPIDDLLETLFNHTLLNDLNKIYPTSYVV
jgi:hypothetical protein